MGDINRDSDIVELAEPPRFDFGERVACRTVVRNDGTFPGRDVGEVLVNRGDVGYVRSVGTFLQQYYIYSVEWLATGHQVGMRAKELCTLDNLPPDVLQLFADRLDDLKALGHMGAADGRGGPEAAPIFSTAFNAPADRGASEP